MEIFEIFTAVLAVFGGYTLLRMLRIALLYPLKLRRSVRACVVYDGGAVRDAAAYARQLRIDKKISSERLIILVKDDIINVDADTLSLGNVYRINKCKENVNDDHANGRKTS